MKSTRRRVVSAQGEPPTGRLSCSVCRDAKTRCDKVYPACTRCMRLSLSCSYEGRKSRNAQQADMARQLAALQERVARAEAHMTIPSQPNAFTQPLDSFGDMSNTPGIGGDLRIGASDNLPSVRISQDIQASHALQSHLPSDFQDLASFDWPAYGQGLTHNASPEDVSLPKEDDNFSDAMPFFQNSQANLDDSITLSELSLLHARYFKAWSPALPIISESRFSAELLIDSQSPAVSCLCYAVALMGTTESTKYAHLASKCYVLTRRYLELCETAEDEGQLASLNAIQAFILLFRHELAGRTSFTRAWITLGRAIRLAKLINLHHIDQQQQASSHTSNLQIFLPPTQDEAILEERRRTFWALYIFDSYATTRTGMPCQLVDSKFHVRLSCPGLLTADFSSIPMPFVSEASSISDASSISSWTAIVLMVEFAFRSFDHARSHHTGREDKGFWDRHYSLIKDLTFLIGLLKTHLAESAINADSLLFSLIMNLSAVEILLHDTAIDLVRRQALPESVALESQNSAHAAAVKVLRAVKLNRHAERSEDDLFFMLQGPFIGWPMVMAMKVLVRKLNQCSHLDDDDSGAGTSASIASSVSLLLESLDLVEDHAGYWHTSASEVAAALKQRDVENEAVPISEFLEDYEVSVPAYFG